MIIRRLDVECSDSDGDQRVATVILLGHIYRLIWESFPIQKWPLFSQFHVF